MRVFSARVALTAVLAAALMACGVDAGEGSDERAHPELALELAPRAGDPPPGTTLPPGPPFDRAAAVAALVAVDVQSCKKTGGPTGLGHVTVTFVNNGTVSAAIVGPPYAGTSVGGCVATKYRAVRVPAFGGSPVTIGKFFYIE